MNERVLKRILLVEDEADIQDVAKLALEAVGGFTVEACSSGIEALERLEPFGPDLVLLDVMMPGLDGPATLDALKKMDKMMDVPVIFMTAKAQSFEIEELKLQGALEVIPKPFDAMTLAQTVTAIWHTRHDR